MLAAGCGGSSSGGSTSTPTTVAGGHVVEIDVVASGFAYTTATETAPAGPVVIRSKNPQSLGHDISLKGNGVDLHGEVVSGGGVSVIAIADLKAETYVYYCSVPGHEAAGMKGTLTVS